METGALNRSDFKNTAELHHVKSPPMVFKSKLFLPPILSHPGPGKAARTPI
jgi:hypothetical protein